MKLSLRLGLLQKSLSASVLCITSRQLIKEEPHMDNFDAIKRMDKAALEDFLDQVYLTGLNTGMYAATLPNDSKEQAKSEAKRS